MKLITQRNEFRPVKNETDIFSAIGESDDDFPALLNAAQRAVSHGYRVFILPNPKGIRTADFIFERKGVYRMYDLKTIQGKASILNRLVESIGQTNHVLLNMATEYNAHLLALQIQKYFEWNPDAGQILIPQFSPSFLYSSHSSGAFRQFGCIQPHSSQFGCITNAPADSIGDLQSPRHYKCRYHFQLHYKCS